VKHLGLLTVLLFASPLLQAQVKVEVALDQQQFLPGESLPVILRVINHSGQTLYFGADNTWLDFSVETQDGHAIGKTAEFPPAEAFALDSAQRATRRIDIAPCFNLTARGHYKVRANVLVQEWNQVITSPPVEFDIIEAAKLWEQDFGVPLPQGVTNRPAEIRRYSLQEANYLKHLTLYFRVSDRTGRINKVFPLGQMISFGQPDARLDKVNNLHVLYQNGPHSFYYTVIDPDGDVIVRRNYEYTTRPRLRADENGNFDVIGGTRRVSESDLPPPTAAELMPPPAVPMGTNAP
jgi:hypothetical protein